MSKSKRVREYQKMQDRDRSADIICKIEEWIEKNPKKMCMLSIDGMSASGKSSLGKELNQKFGGILIHMDDFFLRPEQKSRERLLEIGGNVDYERVWDEVLRPIRDGEKQFLYRRYNCKTQCIQKEERMDVKGLLCIVEGSYSAHPRFGDLYDIRILLTVNDNVQKERILLRNGQEMQKRFVQEWIPMENRYIEEFDLKEKSHIIMDTSGLWE